MHHFKLGDIRGPCRSAPDGRNGKPFRKPAAGTCCALGSAKGQLVAMANNAAALEQTASGKKPNILFIMGDDIGWMQPACYHRGLMVGETPNIDRIAAEGGIFMHYF